MAHQDLRAYDRSVANAQADQPVEPDLPDDPSREKDLPDVNPGSNPDNPGDRPAVREPGKPERVVAGSM